jgi:sec-independent protein translocase protein TatA
MFGSVGALEIGIIALVAILLFGTSKLAGLGKGLGDGIKNFKKGLKEANEDEVPVPVKAEKT